MIVFQAAPLSRVMDSEKSDRPGLVLKPGSAVVAISHYFSERHTERRTHKAPQSRRQGRLFFSTLDVVPHAVAPAQGPTLAFAVADLWTEWPVRWAAVDLIISIFAPKNFAEAARVLRSGGLIAVAYPGADHMIELRDRFGLMHRHEAAAQPYAEAVERFVGPPTFHRLRRQAVLDDAGIRCAILMGPNARRISGSALDTHVGPITVTFDVTVLFARKK